MCVRESEENSLQTVLPIEIGEHVIDPCRKKCIDFCRNQPTD